MTRRRWIADEAKDDRAALTGANARHLARVLRAKVGQEFDIVCGDGVRSGKIEAVTDDRVEFLLGENVETVQAAEELTVVIAVFKFDRLEWAIEKLTELGVSRIVPVIARRTETHLARAAEKRVERWRRIAHEASQQSRRSDEPIIDCPVGLGKVLAEAAPGLLADEAERPISLSAAARGMTTKVIAIGPEGGWSDDERELFRTKKWQAVSLGATVLRAETAAIYAVSVMMELISSELR